MTWLERLCAVGKWVSLAVIVGMLVIAAFEVTMPLIQHWDGR